MYGAQLVLWPAATATLAAFSLASAWTVLVNACHLLPPSPRKLTIAS
jgi:hypothetical protein